MQPNLPVVRSAPVSSGKASRQPARGKQIALALSVPLVLIAAWFVTTEAAPLFRPNQLPSPTQVLHTAAELAAGGDLTRHVSASIGRVLSGFIIGASLALLVAVAVGLSKTVERAFDPTLQAVRNVPSLAWVPFLLLWMGIGETPRITLIAIGAFFPVYVNLVSGIRNVDRKLVEVGYVFGLSRADLVRRIIVPAALPYLLTGLRVGLGQAWLFLVAAELIASVSGLGFMLIDGQNNARPDIMLVAILTLALLGKLSDSLLRAVERRALAWTDTFQGR
ncbi:MAG: ABC transporter permease [Anaerolineae bacterium]|nr:ABC transporter permease [Thermoflexales bacterium]MDW8407294.1 ABC transporter permease [Anaerolineae bacterium]